MAVGALLDPAPPRAAALPEPKDETAPPAERIAS
jgi:hypothetical protein